MEEAFMKTYTILTLEQIRNLTLDQLINEYNELIETIGHLQRKLEEEQKENTMLWQEFERLTDELYG